LEVDVRRAVVVLLAGVVLCGIPLGQWSSAGPSAGDPATGAHTLAFYPHSTTPDASITTSAMTTRSSGSTILVGVGRGNNLAHATPTDSKGNTYSQLGSSHTYTKWAGSGTALYACEGTTGGGSGHQVTVSNQPWDEITVGVVEVVNGGGVEDYQWNEDLTDPATSLAVTTAGPAVLVAFWFGDGGVGSVHTATPGNGFSIVESLTLDGGLVQLTVATRFVAGAGTYSVEWRSTSGEGAQLYLVAVRAPGSATTPGLSVVAPNGGESWPLGSQQQIRWAAQSLGTSSTVRVSLVDGGSATVLTTVPSTQSAHVWTVSGSPTTSARVRVECVGCSSAVQDESDGTFAIVAAPPAPPVPSDFNSDGRPDLLWHHQDSGELFAWLLSGTTRSSWTYLSPSRVANTQWQARGLADFNADGKVDVLWHNQATGELYVWLMNGTSFQGSSFLEPTKVSNTQWQVRGVADLDGDGKPDLLWHNQSTGQLFAWLMDGLRRASTSYLTPAGVADTQWQIRGLADLNRDGSADILWQHQTRGDLYVWFLSGLRSPWTSYLSPSRVADTRWQVRRVMDLDDDARPDLLWHNQATGELYVWFMDGVSRVSASYLDPRSVANTRWQLAPR
jgi:hypothetical protein